jgi:prevent-host-death family protein
MANRPRHNPVYADCQEQAAGPVHKEAEKERTSGKGLEKSSYNVTAAKPHLSEILEHVEETGEEIVLTRRGKPVARVVPDRIEGGVRQLAFAHGQIKLLSGWEKPVAFEAFWG